MADTQDTGRSPNGSGSRASHEAAKASSPEASIPSALGLSRVRLAELLYEHEGFCDASEGWPMPDRDCPSWIEEYQNKPHSGDCTKECHPCLTCHGTWALKQWDEFEAAIRREASAIEARRAATVKQGAVEDESAVRSQTPKREGPIMADIEELIERLNRLTPVSWTDEPDPATGEPMYANMQFGEHQTQAMSMRPDDCMALNDIATALSAQQREIAELREALTALNGHVEVMQRMCERWLVPEAYEDRAGVVWSDGDPTPFADDMVYMLDGPEQREAQGKARAALNTPSQEGEKI